MRGISLILLYVGGREGENTKGDERSHAEGKARLRAAEAERADPLGG